MKSELAQILITYLSSKKGSFKSHPAAQFIRHDFPHMLVKEAAISSSYKVDGSAGKGNWAEIPWICVFDKEITVSAQHGYYIVYLFRADMKGVYLSLNQGWTQFSKTFKPTSEAKKKIQEAAMMLRETLRSYDGFDVDTIDLATNSTLGKGYELGHICGKYYDRYKLPHDLTLIDDLRNLIGVYRELKGELLGMSPMQKLADYTFERVNPYVNEGEKPGKKDIEKVYELTRNLKTPEQIDEMLTKLEKIMEGQKPKMRQRLAYAAVRNRTIVDLVKQKANYTCEICKMPGFEKRNGGLYAEAHHKDELGRGGSDLPRNMICVCPLCHRKLHYGKNS